MSALWLVALAEPAARRCCLSNVWLLLEPQGSYALGCPDCQRIWARSASVATTLRSARVDAATAPAAGEEER